MKSKISLAKKLLYKQQRSTKILLEVLKFLLDKFQLNTELQYDAITRTHSYQVFIISILIIQLALSTVIILFLWG